jgi:apolipoprotein N-acyltransferase
MSEPNDIDDTTPVDSGSVAGSESPVEPELHVVSQESASQSLATRPTGVSAGTIGLSLCLLFFAVVALIVGVATPVSFGGLAFGLGARAWVAVAIASFGALLIVVAVVWAIVSALRRNRDGRSDPR